jgi:protein-tyrosine phosphatase
VSRTDPSRPPAAPPHSAPPAAHRPDGRESRPPVGEAASRPLVRLAGAFNVRDLGGLETTDGRRVRPGLLYRGDALSALTEADRRLLFNDLHVGTIVDLRTAEEAGGGDQDAALFPTLDVYRFSIIPEGRIGREPFPDGFPYQLGETYLRNLVEGSWAVVDTIEVIIDSVERGRPALFHCAAGRDRTGLVAAILLGLVGVRDDEIVADYLASNRHAHSVTQRLRSNPLYSSEDRPDTDLVLLEPLTMEVFLDLLRSRFGGVAGWAASHGLPADTAGRLRAAVLR